MNENMDVADYIREVRIILADSIDTLLNLEYEVQFDKDEEIVPMKSPAELVDMIYDVSDSEKLKKAESRLMERQPF
jgi:hypothetical protein